MTVKIAGSTPEGDKNGLAAVVAHSSGGCQDEGGEASGTAFLRQQATTTHAPSGGVPR